MINLQKLKEIIKDFIKTNKNNSLYVIGTKTCIKN